MRRGSPAACIPLFRLNPDFAHDLGPFWKFRTYALGEGLGRAGHEFDSGRLEFLVRGRQL